MKRLILLLMVILALVGAGVGLVRAQLGPGYELRWSTVDGGGAVGAGAPGSYALNGTAGQPDAGSWSGGSYTLSGGFWVSAMAGDYRIYLPLVLRH